MNTVRSTRSGTCRFASLRPPAPRRGVAIYVFGRPLMVVAWGIALWGTVVAARVAWLALSAGPAEAVRVSSTPLVWLPVAIAALAWTALIAAVRRTRT